jgi:hypothetical protein
MWFCLTVGELLVQEEKGPEENWPVGKAEEASVSEEKTDEAELAEEEIEEVLAEEEPIRRGGCLQGCLIPIAVIIVILLVAVVLIYLKYDALREALLMRIISNTQTHVLSQLPEDMDKNAIEAIFERAKAALKEKQIDEEALTEAIEEYQDSISQSQPLEQKRQIINKLLRDLDSAFVASEQEE